MAPSPVILASIKTLWAKKFGLFLNTLLVAVFTFLSGLLLFICIWASTLVHQYFDSLFSYIDCHMKIWESNQI